MKKVCFVIPRSYYLFNPNADNAKDKVGGAQKQAYLLSTKLAKNINFDVHFILADFNQPDSEKIENVSLWKSFNFKDNILKRTRKLIKTLKKVNADYYIFRSADFGVAFITFILKVFLRKKVIYMIASNFETSFSGLKQNSGLLSALTMPFTYKFANKITAQSKEQFDLFVKHRKRKPNIIIKNIIPYNKENNQEKRNTILWVGRLNANKKPELFLELAQKFPKEKFVMIAPTVLEYIEFGKNFVKKAKSIKNIQIISYVNPAEINKYYLKAKIYVMTSESEGFSNTMAEAFANNCPVLSLKVNPDNIFTEQNVGLCAEDDKNKFFLHFKELLIDDNLKNTLTRNAINYIKKNHDKNIIIQNFIKLFDNRKS